MGVLLCLAPIGYDWPLRLPGFTPRFLLMVWKSVSCLSKLAHFDVVTGYIYYNPSPRIRTNPRKGRNRSQHLQLLPKIDAPQSLSPFLITLFLVLVKRERPNLSSRSPARKGETYTFRISASSPSTSPIFLFPGVVPSSSASSASVHSTTSHSTFTLPSRDECPPLCCLMRPSRVFSTISSNHGAPRDCGSVRTTERSFDGPATMAESSSLLSPEGRKPNCPSSAWSSSSRLPTVKQMCSASSRVFSCHDVSCVPQ